MRYKLVFLFCMLLFSCKKDVGIITFSLNYKTDVVVPGSTGANLPFTFPTPEIATNSSQEFKNQGTDQSKIRGIKLQELLLTVAKPSGKNFNFLKSIHLSIVSQGLPEVEVAYKDNIPYDLTSLSLEVIDKDVSDYIKASSFRLVAKCVTREFLNQDVTIRADSKFRVKAALL